MNSDILFGNFLPLTRLRIFVATVMHFFVSPFLKSRTLKVRRGGLMYELDCNEGIDFSLLFFARFQNHNTTCGMFKLTGDDVILDVGANIGTMTMSFAMPLKGGRGHVYAFEPTAFAFNKLQRNISLNPDLQPYISTFHYFVTSKGKSKPGQVYASWPLDKSKENGDLHRLHGGSMRSIAGADAISIDEFVENRRLDRVDIIKIDTDGYEVDVLRGSVKVLKKYRPKVIFEAGKFLMKENGYQPDCIKSIFYPLNYSLFRVKTRKKVQWDDFDSAVSTLTAADFLAIPNEVLSPGPKSVLGALN